MRLAHEDRLGTAGGARSPAEGSARVPRPGKIVSEVPDAGRRQRPRAGRRHLAAVGDHGHRRHRGPQLVTLLLVGVVFGVVNAIVRPVVTILSIPFIILTLGLLIFVINALMLLLTSWLSGQLGLGFHVDGFWTAVLGGIDHHGGHLDHRARGGRAMTRLPDDGGRDAVPGGGGVPGQHLPLADGRRGARPSGSGRRARRPTSRWSAPAPAAGTSAARWTSAPRAARARTGTTRPGTGRSSSAPTGSSAATWCWRWTPRTTATSPRARRRRGRWRCSATSTPGRRPAGDVPDPYFGGGDGFEQVLAMVERTRARWSPPSSRAARRTPRGRAADMARRAESRGAAEALLGTAVVATTPVAGGDICNATRLRLSTGASALMKTRPHAPADFFRTEAAGLRWLARPAGAPCPTVLAAEDDCLVLAWVEGARPTIEAAERLRARAGRDPPGGRTGFGTAAGVDGYIGALPLPQPGGPSWPEFFATRRVLPYLKLARDRRRDLRRRRGRRRGGGPPARRPGRPDEPPARLHGDLWSGNLRLGPGRPGLADRPGGARRAPGDRPGDARAVRLPAAAAGARGLRRRSSPLADGWEDRVALHQLFPLLVHACLFGAAGAGYGARAGAAARSLL